MKITREELQKKIVLVKPLINFNSFLTANFLHLLPLLLGLGCQIIFLSLFRKTQLTLIKDTIKGLEIKILSLKLKTKSATFRAKIIQGSTMNVPSNIPFAIAQKSMHKFA